MSDLGVANVTLDKKRRHIALYGRIGFDNAQHLQKYVQDCLALMPPGQHHSDNATADNTHAHSYSAGPHDTAASVSRHLHEKPPLSTYPRPWTIDWSGVTEIESIALPLLLTWLSFSKRHGYVLRFTHLPQTLFALAKSCGLSEYIVKWID